MEAERIEEAQLEVSVALDLGLQAWRHTEVRSKFHDAFAAHQFLAAALREAQAEADDWKAACEESQASESDLMENISRVLADPRALDPEGCRLPFLDPLAASVPADETKP